MDTYKKCLRVLRNKKFGNRWFKATELQLPAEKINLAALSVTNFKE